MEESWLHPWLVYKFGLWLVSFLEWLLDRILPAPQAVLRKATSSVNSYVIWACCKLNLSEVIGGESMEVGVLAERVGTASCLSVRD